MSHAKRIEELLIRLQYTSTHAIGVSIPQDKLLRLCLAQLRLIQIQGDNWAIPASDWELSWEKVLSVENALWEEVQNAMRAI